MLRLILLISDEAIHNRQWRFKRTLSFEFEYGATLLVMSCTYNVISNAVKVLDV